MLDSIPKKIKGIASIPITTNAKTRESRLFKNIWQHMLKSGQAILRSYIMFKPHIIFATLGTILLAIAVIPFVRFIYFWFLGESAGHIQSLIFGSAMLTGALFSYALLVIADLQKTNRSTSTEIQPSTVPRHSNITTPLSRQ